MSEVNYTNDNLNENDYQQQSLPSGLKVLTILTFIGCAIGAVFTLITPWMMNFALKMMDKAVLRGTSFRQSKWQIWRNSGLLSK